MILACHLLLSSVLLAGTGDSASVSTVPEDWNYGIGTLFAASAAGLWLNKEPVIDSTHFDAAVSVTARSDEVDFLATAATEFQDDSLFSLRRGRAALRWPGTPWLGGSVHISDRQPFVPGIREPLAEWGWIGVDSLSGFGVSGGGILGFNGEYLLQTAGEDTLQQLNIHSPWMGFAAFDYYWISLDPSDSSTAAETRMNVFSLRSNLRYASPWLTVTGGDGRQGAWAFTGEIRDFRPFDTDWGRIEVVPSMSFAGDSLDFPSSAYTPGQRILGLAAYLESRRYMVAGSLEGRVDLESDSLSGIAASAGMVTGAGMTWGARVDIFADGDYRGEMSAGTYDDYAGAGLMLEVVDDSLRITGSASYSPRNDVCGEVSVSADLDDTLQPGCVVNVSSAMGPVRGLLSVSWEYDGGPFFRFQLNGLLR